MTAYCTPIAPDILRVERELPGPIERVWAFLTEPEKRKTWVAAGEFELWPGGRAEHVFRHAELTGTPTGPVAEHRIDGTILAVEPPRLLSYTWEGESEVTFELTPAGDRVRLVVTHSRIANRQSLADYGAGWHSHLNLLADRLTGRTPAPFPEAMAALQAEYAERFPAGDSAHNSN